MAYLNGNFGIRRLWHLFLEWLKENQIGDLAGIAGLIISITGFLATLIGVWRAKSAAARAEQAANAARDGGGRKSTFWIYLFNEAGTLAESFSDSELDVDDPFGSYRDKMRSLFASARRTALGSDEVLDDLLSDLEGE